jgi:hypothetical protein
MESCALRTSSIFTSTPLINFCQVFMAYETLWNIYLNSLWKLYRNGQLLFPTERDGTTSKWPWLAQPLEKNYVTQNSYTVLENYHGLNNVMLPPLVINVDIIPKVTSGLKISRRIKRNKKRPQLDFLVLHRRYAYSKWRYMSNRPQKMPHSVKIIYL